MYRPIMSFSKKKHGVHDNKCTKPHGFFVNIINTVFKMAVIPFQTYRGSLVKSPKQFDRHSTKKVQLQKKINMFTRYGVIFLTN